jgi:hypothetical protein
MIIGIRNFENGKKPVGKHIAQETRHGYRPIYFKNGLNTWWIKFLKTMKLLIMMQPIFTGTSSRFQVGDREECWSEGLLV